jgi:hypothetical protein
VCGRERERQKRRDDEVRLLPCRALRVCVRFGMSDAAPSLISVHFCDYFSAFYISL